MRPARNRGIQQAATIALFEDLGASDFGLRPEQLDALPEAKTREKKRKCPACDKKMRKVTVGPQDNVLIDACPRQHGLWFDGEEVAELAQQVVDAGSAVSDQAIAFMGRLFHKQDSSTEAEGE